MTWEETTVSEPRMISKTAFESLVIVTIVGLSIVEIVAALVIGRALGFRLGEGWVGGLAVLNLFVARLAVDRVLKGFGLSLSGKTLEVRERKTLSFDGDVADDEIAAVGLANPPTRLLRWTLPLMCAVMGSLAFLPILDMATRILGIGVFGFFALATLSVWCDRKPQAWADRNGVTGYPVGIHFRRRCVQWSDVAICEIETFYNTFGEPVLVRPILKGWNDEDLLALDLLNTRLDDQERLVKYIKAKLPKGQDHVWE